MKKLTDEEFKALAAKATAGDKKALETLVTNLQDTVFNLSLRMLGTFADFYVENIRHQIRIMRT